MWDAGEMFLVIRIDISNFTHHYPSVYPAIANTLSYVPLTIYGKLGRGLGVIGEVIVCLKFYTGGIACQL